MDIAVKRVSNAQAMQSAESISGANKGKEKEVCNGKLI